VPQVGEALRGVVEIRLEVDDGGALSSGSRLSMIVNVNPGENLTLWPIEERRHGQDREETQGDHRRARSDPRGSDG
jgi:hypothetical protein